MESGRYANVLCLIVMLFAFHTASAQDIIYTNKGEILKGKITEVGPYQIKYFPSDNINGPVYIVYPSNVDSIIFANGKIEKLHTKRTRQPRGDLKQNIPQFNTWSFDLGGFAFLSFSQSYERRLKNGVIGFRIPLYISFMGGGIAGIGIFNSSMGVYYPANYYSNTSNYIGNSTNLNANYTTTPSGSGSAMATGLNVKCYFFKQRLIRAFAGPEATIGYSSFRTDQYFLNDNAFSNNLFTYGTVAIVGKAGLCINPIDKLNITIDGGAGAGDIFGHEKTTPSPVGFTGVWHIGFALGTNF